mmetsp:Transcript_95001/g.198544  ORF Transcript_95001/g.198544 Transcript_95001/m.198544 type:complete len:273 (-) Transcript_95001:437-1255(-)
MRVLEVAAGDPDELGLFGDDVRVVHRREDHDLALRSAALQSRSVSIGPGDRGLIVGSDGLSVVWPRASTFALLIDVFGLQLCLSVEELDGVATVLEAQGVHDFDRTVGLDLGEQGTLRPGRTLSNLRAAAAVGDPGCDCWVQEDRSQDRVGVPVVLLLQLLLEVVDASAGKAKHSLAIVDGHDLVEAAEAQDDRGPIERFVAWNGAAGERGVGALGEHGDVGGRAELKHLHGLLQCAWGDMGQGSASSQTRTFLRVVLPHVAAADNIRQLAG